MKRMKRMKTTMTELSCCGSFPPSPPPGDAYFQALKVPKRPTWLIVGSMDRVYMHVNIDHVFSCYLLMVSQCDLGLHAELFMMPIKLFSKSPPPPQSLWSRRSLGCCF